MVHEIHTVGLSDFCKLLVTSPQYVQHYRNGLTCLTLIVPVTSVECFSCQNRIKTTLQLHLKNPTLARLVQLAYGKSVSLVSDQNYPVALRK